jgi:hypothetical protein
MVAGASSPFSGDGRAGASLMGVVENDGVDLELRLRPCGPSPGVPDELGSGEESLVWKKLVAAASGDSTLSVATTAGTGVGDDAGRAKSFVAMLRVSEGPSLAASGTRGNANSPDASRGESPSSALALVLGVSAAAAVIDRFPCRIRLLEVLCR